MRKALIISLFIFISLMVFIGCDGGMTGPSDEDVAAVEAGFKAGDVIADVFSGKDRISVSYSLRQAVERYADGGAELIAMASFNGYEAAPSLTVDSGTLLFMFSGSVDGNRFTAESYTVETPSPLKVKTSEGSVAVAVSIDIPEDAKATVKAIAVLDEPDIPSDVTIADLYLPEGSSATIRIGNGDPMPIPSFGESGGQGTGGGGGSSPVPGGDEKVSAPIPVFLKGLAQEIPVLKAAAEELTEEQCFVMYMQFGVPAFIGFEGETESFEIADVEVFDSSVSLTWEESDGVFTYRTIDDGADMDIAIELTYDSVSDSYDYIEAKRCEYDGYYDYYSVSIASDVEYDEATKSWDGGYEAYITMRMPGSEEPYVFNNIASGGFHSENGLTGVFLYHMDHKSSATGDADDGEVRAFDLDAALSEHDGIETARLLIEKMNGVSTTMKVDSYQILYSQNGSYKIFKYSNDLTAEAREACLKHIKEISGGNWNIYPSSIPEPSAID